VTARGIVNMSAVAGVGAQLAAAEAAEDPAGRKRRKPRAAAARR
jgi:hypothetical protein